MCQKAPPRPCRPHRHGHLCRPDMPYRQSAARRGSYGNPGGRPGDGARRMGRAVDQGLSPAPESRWIAAPQNGQGAFSGSVLEEQRQANQNYYSELDEDTPIKQPQKPLAREAGDEVEDEQQEDAGSQAVGLRF
jgi:hypothetical protein